MLSRRTSAHVHSVFHVNFSTIEKIRQQKKAEYERLGTKLTYMAFIAKAVIDALRRYPIVNASIDGDNVVYKRDINLGIAVALESGLIVPVLKHADEKNLLGLSRGIADLAERARAKQLKPDEVHDGTFTITASKTIGVDAERLFDAVASPERRERWLPGVELHERTSTPPRSARFDWPDGGTRVNVTVTAVGKGKASVGVEHERLPDEQVAAERKEFWRDRLSALKVDLER